MFFQRIEDLRIDHDKTQQEIAQALAGLEPLLGPWGGL